MSEVYHKENPFIHELRRQVKLIMKSRKRVGPIMNTLGELITDEEGLVTVTTHTGSFLSYEDNEPFIKFYIEHIGILRKITAPGLLIFTYVLEASKPKQDVIHLNSMEVAQKLGISRTYAYHGIKSLCDENVIARKFTGKRSAAYYWINPTVFYNGNRHHLLMTTKQE